VSAFLVLILKQLETLNSINDTGFPFDYPSRIAGIFCFWNVARHLCESQSPTLRKCWNLHFTFFVKTWIENKGNAVTIDTRPCSFYFLCLASETKSFAFWTVHFQQYLWTSRNMLIFICLLCCKEGVNVIVLLQNVGRTSFVNNISNFTDLTILRIQSLYIEHTFKFVKISMGICICILTHIGVGANKFLGVRRNIAQISANLPEIKSKENDLQKQQHFTRRIFQVKALQTPFLRKFHPSFPKLLLICPKTTKLKHDFQRKKHRHFQFGSHFCKINAHTVIL